MIAITLDDVELCKAVKSHIASMGLDITNKDIEINITAGRGVNGNTATVVLNEANNNVKDCACEGGEACGAGDNKTSPKEEVILEAPESDEFTEEEIAAAKAKLEVLPKDTTDKVETDSIFKKKL